MRGGTSVNKKKATTAPAPSAPAKFDAFQRRRLAELAKDFEAALTDSRLMGADHMLGQFRATFAAIAAGTVTQPVRRAPGGRAFLESELPGDPKISKLYHLFCTAIEQKVR